MPANIDETTGAPAIAFYGEIPWHGIGTKVDSPMTAEEAIKLGKLDWNVEKRPIWVDERVVNTHKAIVREDTQGVLGIVGNRYEPVQNSRAFDFFDAVAATKEAKYHTVGALDEGKRIWLLAKMSGSLAIKKDVVDKYVLLVNSHNGTLALTMMWTPIRVVCQNTLNIALQGAGERFYARHTLHISDRMERARQILGIANSFYQSFQEEASRMATLALPAPRIEQLVTTLLLPAPKQEELATIFVSNFSKQERETVYAELRKNQKYAVEKVLELAETGKGQDPEIRGTAWGVFNAFAEYTDYWMPSRKGTLDAKANSLLFGSGADLKQRAWDLLKREG